MRKIVVLILAIFLATGTLFGHEAGQHLQGEDQVRNNEKVGICPVMHRQADKKYSYTYEGKTYYFCCPMCLEAFKKEPKKYISKIKEINLTAYQFGFSPDPIVVEKGDIVKLRVTTQDVPHGVYIKEYGINVAVKKGETKRIEFFADKRGEFDILCSVYCGLGHSQMKGKLIVK